MIKHDCIQGSQEWHELRRGRPTASEFKRIMMPKKMQLSTGADKYACELIGDLASPFYAESAETFTNRAMRWGIQCEQEARDWYALETGFEVEQIGFITTDDGRFGCSPDGGVLTAQCGLELKCPEAGTQIERVLDGVVPDEYLTQVHGGMIVSGLKKWDFVSYHPGCTPFRATVEWSDYTDKLWECLELFWGRFVELMKRLAPKEAERRGW